MNVKQNFIHWYFNEFTSDPLYTAMANTVEDSPWHREGNVGIHTDMVVAEYLSRSIPVEVRGAIACAFHDVGKPPSEIIKFREDRGEYRAYHGHELVSARMWENWAVKNWIMITERFKLTPRDIYTIGWMIEHHVPWTTKKEDKLNAFAITAYETLRERDTWSNVLLSDQFGRISDPSHERGEEATLWIADHHVRYDKAEWRWEHYGDKTVFMFIAAPGAGKSTHRTEMLKERPNALTLSMDDLRIEWYGNEYDAAWLKSSKDSKFRAKVDKVYIEMLRTGEDVILDNTNTATKARRRWIAPARARDFRIVAVVFPVALDTIKKRQKTRTDHAVPDDVVETMYNRLSLPLYGDFDDVIVASSNLPT